MKHNKKLVTVYSKDGMYLIKTPNGEMMPCLQWIRVSDNWPEQPYLIARMDCNIANNNEHFEEPIKLYNQKDFDELNTKNYALWLDIKELNRELKSDKLEIECLKKDMEIIEGYSEHKTLMIKEIQSKWWYRLFNWFD